MCVNTVAIMSGHTTEIVGLMCQAKLQLHKEVRKKWKMIENLYIEQIFTIKQHRHALQQHKPKKEKDKKQNRTCTIGN